MSDRDGGRAGEVRTYLVGYAFALILTAAAFAAVRWPSVEANATFAIVLVLALAQAVVQFRCFLHLGFDRSTRDDLQLVLFSTLIVALMVGGTLVILFNLRARMM